ncbi:hypothetical protein SLEP1_g55464 [Rubroshorea leprosula]|uniref:Disease resistance RPP13-like protein 1 n=1 Tax=Rubroshorea leprosula TaxID=152421 RepID=A0AAV5MIG3_9ROSI|nr:hypothetical protein SLEP1_g55464 [Rubroshorea leprosula]
MEFLSFAGGFLLPGIFDSLRGKLNEYISDQLIGYISDQLQNSEEEVRAQMESWKTLLSKITAILQHAEDNQGANMFVKSYLDDLKDLAYDMEDILEEFVIDARRSELTAEPDARPNRRQKCLSNIMNLFRSKAKPNQKIGSMVNDLKVRLERFEKEMHTFGLFNLALKLEDKSHKVVVKRLPESSLLEDMVLGRDSDQQAILQRLLEDGGNLEQDFIIPIVGMGGLGKTTLARLIYNDEKLKSRFDLKAWVCVSDEFDVARITRTILEQVTRKRCALDDFSSLQEELKGELSGRKFFLVLDDVWNKEYGNWDTLKRPFMSGALGSKIIVTTRNKDVGTMMRGDDGVYNLELLQDDACLPLFTRHALGKEDFAVHPDLQDVGEKLVERCKRLPLALKTLAGVLRGKLCRDEWENILNSDIWSLSEDRSGILPTLRLSYNDLPCHLKRCFAYCALFPTDHEFDKKELVLLWMAEGLLQQQSHGKKQIDEEIGHQYFQELLSRSLFQQSSGDESRFVMHDLINDLAVDVAKEIYCNLERDERLEKARHLSFTQHRYEISKRFIILNKLKNLRTFLSLKALSYWDDFYLSNQILHDFLPNLNCLRVLSLCGYQISKLPDSFENLKHIRYINLSNTQIECLSESVGSLLFLQTLLLYGCHQLTKLPTTIGNLIDLHCLDITETHSLKEMPSGIGNLKNLVTLSKFMVGKASGMMRLSDLKNLLQLQGRLSILDLQNVSDVRDAGEANLNKIHGLEELVLKWTILDNNRDESVLEMQVLSWLKPHSNLKSLQISCYGGKSFPNWVCDPLLFLNLSSMELSNCKRCTLLPSLGLLHVLKKLIIKGMEAIEAVGLEFYGQHDSFRSLEELVFQDLLNWKEWTSPIGSEGEFPFLCRLVIENCPELLGQLPNNLSSLKELEVRGCNAVLLKSRSDLISLANLKIVNISELTCLPESFTQFLRTLKTLDIENCNDLTCLWEEGTKVEQSLLPFNLKHLSIVGCGALESLPDAMMVRMDGSGSSNTSMLLSRLEELEIGGCDSLKSFPGGKLPITLKYLRIEDCKGLGSLPDIDGDINNSSLHLKIRNVPCLYSSLPAFVKEFAVGDCEWLELFPERMLQYCTGLQQIRIEDCKILKSLPPVNCVSNLLSLNIFGCEVLESLPDELGLCTPNLKHLAVIGCKNFKSLPNTMYQLESLQVLWMAYCPSIEFIPDGGLPPNLTWLSLQGCKNLRRVPNTMYQLTSLQILEIPGGALMMGLQNLTSLQNLQIEQKFPLDIVLPSSLTSLLIWDEENLKSIPEGLFQNLSSLEELFIFNCPKLRSLPKEAFLPSLGKPCIIGCPHLKRQRFEAKGDYWTLTRGIPNVEINKVDHKSYPACRNQLLRLAKGDE